MESGSKQSIGELRRKFNDILVPISPRESGEGLPYAAIDWPNPGDIWRWKVGIRIKSTGIYWDRFLIAPVSLQETPTRKLWFGSKKSVHDFIRSRFPNANVDAFFASFSWDIPAKVTSEERVS